MILFTLEIKMFVLKKLKVDYGLQEIKELGDRDG